MAEPEKKRNILLQLAVEGVIPVLGGCAGAMAGGPVAGVAGVAVGHVVERAINLFGRGIVAKWQEWFSRHPKEVEAAVAELAEVSPAEARAEARSLILKLAPDVETPDIDLAVEFVSAIPCAVDRALVPKPEGDGRSLPATVSFDNPRSLLQLLPEDIPPYAASSELPGTPYRLVELLGTGGFGAVYRAVSPTLQHLPLAIKFCLDKSLLPALNQERSNLERLMRAGGAGSRHVVRLYGYDLDHATPYLVYEYVEGGDLTRLVASRSFSLGRGLDPAGVLEWVIQIAEGLAFAHRAGLVHRDLKPANVLFDNGILKLADFGLGGIAAARAAARSRIGTSTVDYLSLADQASLFRGAGTPLYMSPEQRRGAAPDARHDLYALGVVWYQLLIGDVSRELHHGWAKELAVRFGVPPGHIALIERCVGWYDERPKDACELLPVLKEAAGVPATGERSGTESALPFADNLSSFRSSRSDTAVGASQVTPMAQSPSGARQRVLVTYLARLDDAHGELRELKQRTFAGTVLRGLILAMLVGGIALSFSWALDRGKTSPGCFFLAILTWIGYVTIARFVRVRAAARLNDEAATLIDEMGREFSDDVALWGGRAVLRHPGTVRQILEELNPRLAEMKQWRKASATLPAPRDDVEAVPPSPTSTLTPADITSDPTRRTVLVARMRDHAKLLKDTKDNTDLTWAGLIFLWIVIVLMVVAALGAILFERRPYQALMAVLAVTGGLLAIFGTWHLMAAIRRSLTAQREEGIARFAADYPKLLEEWGGRMVLESPETIAALIRNYDPDSVPRPGFLRRLFGG